MLHKKGDPKCCENYRSIALLNNVLKLITHMLSQRIICWSEDHKIFSESQAGFRPGRGCIDNVFSLSSIVSIYLIKQRKLFAAFIDFKSAFSNTDHALLFSKMFDFGISGKTVNLIRNIYRNARTQVRAAA